MKAVPALALALLLGGCAFPDPGGYPGPGGEIVVPLHEGPDNVFSFDLWVGPEAFPARVLLDTGSSFTALSPHLSTEADPAGRRIPVTMEGVHEVRETEAYRGRALLSFRPAGGRAFEVREAPFWELRIPHGHDGLAGLAVFPGRLVTLDLAHREVVVRDGALPEPDGAACLPLRVEGGIPSVDVVAAGVPLRASVDSGFFGTLYVDPETAARLPLSDVTGSYVRVRDVHGDRVLEERRLLGAMRVGDQVLESPWVMVGEGEPLLGVGALRRLRVTFDLASRRVRVEPSAPRAREAAGPGGERSP